MKDSKTLQALGLCAKARVLIMGTPLICDALKADAKKICLVIGASDNSENTAKRLRDRCAYYGVPLHLLEADGDALSRALGKHTRVAAVAVTDEQLSRLVKKTLQRE